VKKEQRGYLLRRRTRGFSEVVGSADGEDTLIAADQEHPFEQAAALVVKKIFVPVAFDEFRNHHNDAALWMQRGQFEDVLKNRYDDEPVRRRQDQELGRRMAGCAERRLDVALPLQLQ